MALTFNGVSPTAITYNGVNLTSITFNGVTVWTAFTSKDFPYTGTIQPWTVPVTGTYKLEVWGARGGNAGGYDWGGSNPFARSGGLGGYAAGNVTLTAGTVLYICVGGQGGDVPTNYSKYCSAGGYNGGGTQTGTGDYQCAGGGGATHIGKSNALLKNTAVANLYIAAGGGGGAGSIYNGNISCGNGGAGGGTTGSAGSQSNWAYDPGAGGTQSSAGANGDSSTSGGYGYGGTSAYNASGAGGGGYYGGGAGSHYAGGGGGSGYIGGVTSGSTQSGKWAGNGKAKITLL